MPIMDKRTFLKILAVGTAGAGSLPWLMQQAQADSVKQAPMPEGYYSIPKKGQARILHTTDVHGTITACLFS